MKIFFHNFLQIKQIKLKILLKKLLKKCCLNTFSLSSTLNIVAEHCL